MKAARPVREGGPGKRTRGNSDTAPGADPHCLRGGRTDLDNLILLCSFHHTRLHDHGYRIVREGGGGFAFSRPDGTPVPAAGEPLDGDAERLLRAHDRFGPRIDPENLTPGWSGERLDMTPILSRLLADEPEPTRSAA